jgi:hypothetical protein
MGDSDLLRVDRRHPSAVRALVIGVAIVLIGTAAIASVVAVNPNLFGRWFTIRTDVDPGTGAELYKVLARVNSLTITAKKTADVDIDIRVFNNHTFDVHVVGALFTIVNLNLGETSLIFALGDLTIPALGSADENVVAVGFKSTGLGNRYRVEGSVSWHEVVAGVEGPLLFESFSEVHSLTEFGIGG